ncbi:MAG: hypothetical protein R3E02_15035 [Blastomonas sp.]
MRQFIMVSVGALALAGCGGSETTTYTDDEGNKVEVTQSGDGDEPKEVVIKSEDGDATFRMGGVSTEELPFGFEVYPGAQVITSSVGTSEGRTGGVVAMKTSDSQDKVIAYYKAAAEKRGLTIKAEISSGEMKMLNGEAEGGDKGGFTIQAIKQPDGTQITLIAGGER